MLHFEEIGLSVEVPAHWYLQPSAWVGESRRQFFTQSLLKGTTVPVLCATRFEDTVASVNPTFQIMFRPSPDPSLSAMEALDVIYPAIAAMLGADTLEAPSSCTIDEEDAAYCRVRYRLATDVYLLDIVTRFWLVTRGTHLVMLSGAGPASGPYTCEDEFSAIMRSVLLTTPPWVCEPGAYDRRTGRMR